MLRCKNNRHGRTNFALQALFCLIGGQALAAAALLALSAAPLPAQTLQPSSPDYVPPSAGSLIDPQVQRDADEIKKQTWRSAPAGEQGNWTLDIGRFEEDKDEEQDLRERISEDVESYSGMRLRLPLKGGQ